MDLRSAYRQARAAGASRHRDIAAGLGVSEGRLLDAHVGAPADGLQAQRLRRPFPELLAELQDCGNLLAQTRNEACVHECTGVYEQLSHQGESGMEIGLALGEEIDLRIFYRHWFCAYSVREGDSQSLQFFDASGSALHKIFTRPSTAMAVWHRLRVRWVDLDMAAPRWQSTQRHIQTSPHQVDSAAFRTDWAALRDGHELFDLLKKHGLRRIEALQLAEPCYAQRLDGLAARALLQAAAGNATPITVFVGNPGLMQIHSGPVQRIVVSGSWLNVLEARFNLHLREDAIHQAWAVRRPTVDGLVSSLELFDADGEPIAQFFDQRKAGQPERCAWRQALDNLVHDPAWSLESAGCAA